MRRMLLAIGGMFLVVCVLWLLLVVGNKRALRPKISVTLLGYTNDTTGRRLAAFAITNLSPSAVIRAARYWIQSPGAIPQNGTNLSWNLFTAGREARLAPGDSETLLAVTPTNQSSWRIALFVQYPESVARRVVRETLDWANIPRIAYGFQSEWIDQ